VSDQPANILFICSDQHARRFMGCSGHPKVQTPNLDRLAANGARFANSYCNSPLCVPSRASFATGRYPHQTENWDAAKPYAGTEADSWGRRLNEQGHRVVTIGKLHYRAVDDPTGFPDQRLPMHVLNGVGDLFTLLRENVPPTPESRRVVLEAGPGDSEYLRYDRATAQAATAWLRDEAGREEKPWVLMVSFVTPHFPLIAPPEDFARYPLDQVPLPPLGEPEGWPDHPVFQLRRRIDMLEEPFQEEEIRTATAAYFGLVTFLDRQIGTLLKVLGETGLGATTRVIYTSDHGEMLGGHGIWGKSTLYEDSVGVPLIVAGPGVPAGRVVGTNASLVDLFPTIVEGAGATLDERDRELPGRSLWRIAQEPDQPRHVFAEYHAEAAPSAMYMLRDDRYKYVHYVGYEPQLFDLRADPEEAHDLAGDSRHADLVQKFEAQLRAILDPEETDRRARRDQERRIAAHGGPAKIIEQGLLVPYTPAPAAFEPAPVAARERTQASRE
jgi:choline-sulfatase